MSGNGKKVTPMMARSELKLVQAVLSYTRKTKHHEWHIDEQHVAEVLEALRICGFSIVPRGIVMALRKALEKIT